MANACTALNTVTRKPGLSGFFSSSERTNWHISAGVAVFENCDVEEGEDEEDVLLLDVAVVVRLPVAALLRSSSFSPSLWSFEDLEMLPLLRRLSPPLVFSSDDGEKGEGEEEEVEALPLLPRRPLPLSQQRAPLLVSLLDDDDDDVVTIRGEGAPERRRECIFFFYVYLRAVISATGQRGRRGKKRRRNHMRGSLFSASLFGAKFLSAFCAVRMYVSTSKFYSLVCVAAF